MFLKDNGYLFLVIKSRSIDVTKDPKKIFESEIKKLEGSFKINQVLNLGPYDKDHAIVIGQYSG